MIRRVATCMPLFRPAGPAVFLIKLLNFTDRHARPERPGITRVFDGLPKQMAWQSSAGVAKVFRGCMEAVPLRSHGSCRESHQVHSRPDSGDHTVTPWHVEPDTTLSGTGLEFNFRREGRHA